MSTWYDILTLPARLPFLLALTCTHFLILPLQMAFLLFWQHNDLHGLSVLTSMHAVPSHSKSVMLGCYHPPCGNRWHCTVVVEHSWRLTAQGGGPKAAQVRMCIVAHQGQLVALCSVFLPVEMCIIDIEVRKSQVWRRANLVCMSTLPRPQSDLATPPGHPSRRRMWQPSTWISLQPWLHLMSQTNVRNVVSVTMVITITLVESLGPDALLVLLPLQPTFLLPWLNLQQQPSVLQSTLQSNPQHNKFPANPWHLTPPNMHAFIMWPTLTTVHLPSHFLVPSTFPAL